MQPFLIFVAFVAIAFVGCNAWLILSWKGGWRITVAILGVAYILTISWIGAELWMNDRSHSMWPFEIIIWSGYGLAALAALAVFRVIVTDLQKRHSRGTPSA